MISAEPPSFAKEAAKVPEGSPKKGNVTSSGKAPEASKDSKKRVRGFLSVKNVATRALEMKGYSELKKPDPSIVAKDSKDTFASSPEQPQNKKPKYFEFADPGLSRRVNLPILYVSPLLLFL